jgi:kynurenine formamidase
VDCLTGHGRDVHEKYSYASDAILMFLHLGTHIDSLVHLGYYDTFWNGITTREHLGSRGWAKGGAEGFPPIIARGVLLDVAGLHGVDALPDDHAIGPAELKAAAAHGGIELRRGDVVLIRTGRIRRWPDLSFLAAPMPGIDLAGARWLCEEAGAMIIGADTPALEAFPSADRAFTPVHAYMFATAGAPIIEVLWLEELAAEGVHEFVFTGLPLKIRGATGSPLRPVAMPFRLRA